jgi:hypothetical protein
MVGNQSLRCCRILGAQEVDEAAVTLALYRASNKLTLSVMESVALEDDMAV